jgi:uncharacterized delta-60 repeat protein
MQKIVQTLSLLFSAAVPGIGTATAADGALDTRFGTNGIALTGLVDADPVPSGCKPIVQPDGGIVVCGTRRANDATGSDFVVARFDADGALDADFGTGGLVTIDFDHGAGGDQANGIAMQADGSFIVAGTTHGAEPHSANFAVARLTADGRLDTAFAAAGKTIVSFDRDKGAGDDNVYAMTLQPDGAIVLAGSAETADGIEAAVARLNPDGTLDTTFGADGRVTFRFGLVGTGASDAADGVAIDADGRIVIAGSAQVTDPQEDTEFAAARLLHDGTFDTSFDGDGRATIPFDPGTGVSDAIAFGLMIQRDGRIVIPGYANASEFAMKNMDMALARLDPDGSLDATFGNGGRVLIALDLEPDGIDAALDVVEQSDGRLLLVGTSLAGLVQYGTAARVTSTGVLDDSFGTLGTATYDLGLTDPSSTQAFTGAALQGTQFIVAGIGYVPPLGSPQPLDYFVVRLSDEMLFADGFE